MILILLVLVFLFLYLYLNEVSKNEKKEAEEKARKEAEEKKPTVEQCAKKLSETFFDRKIICDNSNSSRSITFHFK